MIRFSVLLLVFFVSLSNFLFAKENVNGGSNKSSNDGLAIRNRAAGCTAPTSSFDLNVNNVEARIMNGGDMWWDLTLHFMKFLRVEVLVHFCRCYLGRWY